MGPARHEKNCLELTERGADILDQAGFNEKHSLFDRNEEKYECGCEQAETLIKELSTAGLARQEWGKSDTIGIANIVFGNSSKIEENEFDDYERIRLRSYYRENIGESPITWVELRKVAGKSVTKKRFPIDQRKIKEIAGWKYVPGRENEAEINKILKEKKQRPIVAIDYKRRALNSKDGKIRVTIDTEIKYHKVPASLERFKLGDFIGEDNIAIIKVKYTKKLPKNIAAIIGNLPTMRPLSKMKRALYFLNKSEKTEIYAQSSRDDI